MSVIIEGFYIFDEQNRCILEHVYTSRPPTAKEILSHLIKVPAPIPAITYLTSLSPQSTIYNLAHAPLLICCSSSTEAPSLAVLEFLRRTVDVFEDFLGSPLLASKIEENYEVVAQLLNELCDRGFVCNMEPNALRESVEVSTLIGKLFTQVGLPSASPSLQQQPSLSSVLKPTPLASNQPVIPWRRPNVRHTSNELYVDMIESIHIISAPSGRPISAMVTGNIAFTAKISGVPELLLTLSAPGGSSSAKSAGIQRTMQLPSFHPCVRLPRWKEYPGELSFVPPDGKFILAGYEADLLPSSINSDEAPNKSERIFMPAQADIRIGLGPTGTDFEANLTLNTSFPGSGLPSSKSASGSARGGGSVNNPFSFASGSLVSTSSTSSSPTFEGSIVVHIPFPAGVRTITDLKPSRGEAVFHSGARGGNEVEWRIPTRDKDAGSINGVAVLTGTVVGPLGPASSDESSEDTALDTARAKTMAGYYDDSTGSNSASYGVRDSGILTPSNLNGANNTGGGKMYTPAILAAKTKTKNEVLMPRTISVSFNIKGWLPSGIRVDSLVVDAKRSKGLGDGVRPFKGVKYIAVSRRGLERRVER